MVAGRSGALAGVRRHDYLPFGEELLAGAGGRNTQQGYSQADGVRQKFTGYERDAETDLDYAKARYYSNSQGRFMSVDPFDIITVRQKSPDDEKTSKLYQEYLGAPQRWNRYVYSLNSPTVHTDPTGLDILVIENGPTSGNPAGHTAIAITGRGVYSFGNAQGRGSDRENIIRGSLKDYLKRELPNRDTKVYLIKTTPAQDAAAAQALEISDAYDPQIVSETIAADNCSLRANRGLDAAGIESGPIPPNLPGSAGARAVNSEAFAGALEIPRNSNLLGTDLRDLRQFEPRTPIPRPGQPGGTPVVTMRMPTRRRND
jgi:RHS repeat-associated protein